MAMGMDIAGMAGKITDQISGNIYQGLEMSQDAHMFREQMTARRKDQRLDRDKFGLQKMLANQEFRAVESRENWRRRFMHALGGGQ